MRRARYEQHGYDGLFDQLRGMPSPQRVPLSTVEQVLALDREKYFDLNVRHFHEKLGERIRNAANPGPPDVLLRDHINGGGRIAGSLLPSAHGGLLDLDQLFQAQLLD